MANLSISTSTTATESHSVSQDQRLSMWKIIVLHLFPGALITAFFFLTAPVLIRAGYPPIMGLYLAILLILIPFELGFLLYQGKKRNGRFSLDGVVLFRERTPIGQMIVVILVLFGWGGLLFNLISNLDSLITLPLFTWFPVWSYPVNLLGKLNQYSTSALIITFAAGFILNGIAGPIVEELYFRGYLLPRISTSKGWAPFSNVALFSLYHFFSPWQNLTRIIIFLPIAYAVSWKRNIYISIMAHCLLNTAGMVMTLVL